MSAAGGHWLITGAAGSIGAALARRVRSRWPASRLTLVDVDQAGLDRCAVQVGGAVETRIWDLTDTAALDAHWDAVEPVDCLVNCAGVMDVQTVSVMSWARAERVLTVDLMAPLRLQARALAEMSERGQGVVVNIASMAGVTPLRGCAYYGAAKAGLAMASEIARMEQRDSGIRVVTVYPGPVVSALEQGARAQVPANWVTRALPTGDAESLADAILDAVEKDRPRVVYPLAYGLGWRAKGLASWVTSRFSPMPLD